MIIFNNFGVSTNAIFQVSYATQLTAWSAGPEAGVAVAGLAQQASKLQLGKVHRWPLVRLNLPDSKQILILCLLPPQVGGEWGGVGGVGGGVGEPERAGGLLLC